MPRQIGITRGTFRQTIMMRADDASENTGDVPSNGSPQCRICFDGPDWELGRLIRPCLCKGSMSVGLRADYHKPKATHPFSPLS